MLTKLVAEKTQEGHARISAARPSPQSGMDSTFHVPAERPPKVKASGMEEALEQRGMPPPPLALLLLLPPLGAAEEEEKILMRMPVQAPPPIEERDGMDDVAGTRRFLANVPGSRTARAEMDAILSSSRRIISTRAKQKIVTRPAMVQKPPSGLGLNSMDSPYLEGFLTE